MFMYKQTTEVVCGLFFLRVVPKELGTEGVDDIKDILADIGEVSLHKGFR